MCCRLTQKNLLLGIYIYIYIYIINTHAKTQQYMVGMVVNIVCLPYNEIQPVKRLSMMSIKLSMWSWRRLLHSASNALRSSDTHVGGDWRAATFRPNMFHKCFIGFKLGDDHSIRVISSDWKHLFTKFSWWERALSSINTNSASMAPLNKSACCSRKMYRLPWFRFEHSDLFWSPV